MARSTQHQWHSFARPLLRRPRTSASSVERQQRPTKRQPLHRRLRIEPLEDRRLLAVVTVTTLNDTVDLGDGVTSLREAIFATNTVPGADTIEFAASLTSGGPATILLTQGELAITDSLAVNGPGANLLTIDASGNDPTPDVNNGDGSRVFNIDDDNAAHLLDVSISGFTLTGGDLAGDGGAILSLENLLVSSSTISSSSASKDGGGIAGTIGTVTVIGTTISANSAAGRGGGISKLGSGNVTVTNSTISGNFTVTTGAGGGIWDAGISSNLTVTDSNISGNKSGNTSSTGSGGGIAMGTGGGTVTVTGSTITGNSTGASGGGIIGGIVTVTNSTISGNLTNYSGGGIRGTIVTVTGSTISNNLAGTVAGVGAGGGGGIFSDGVATITNSTITGNSTIFGNGGGIRKLLGSAVLSHTIVAGNTRGGAAEASDVTGGVAIVFSLLGVNTGATITDNGGNLIGTADAPIDPLLGPLADNGGPTFTHALLAGSPAINRGDLTAVAGVGGVSEFDQRGGPFGRVFWGRIDIGAFEYQAASDLNLVVDTLTDESDGNYALGDLSLREALLLANMYPCIDTIHFAPALSGGTVLLTMGELTITDDTTIDGIGADLLTIRAFDLTPGMKNGDGSRALNIDDGNAVNLLDVSISGLTLTGGDIIGSGGAIYSRENVSVTDCTISGNSTTGVPFNVYSGAGAGIYSRSGDLTIVGATISGNTATGPGGGVSTRYEGDLTVSASTITGNSAVSGGGINGAFMTVANSTISGNSAVYGGGGIGGGNVTVTNSTISGNSVAHQYSVGGGGISSTVLTVSNSTISGNTAKGHGGGVLAAYLTVNNTAIIDNAAISNLIRGAGGGGIWAERELAVTSSTISGNSALGQHSFGGGGIFRNGNPSSSTTIASSTFSGNWTDGYGGGIYMSGGTLIVTGSTISDNKAARSGGGILASVTLTGSTVSGNTAGENGGGIAGFTSVSGSTVTGNTAGGNGGGLFGTGSIINSTISANSAGENGGGIWGSNFVTASTVSGNSAGGNGGGIFTTLTVVSLTLTNTTVSENAAVAHGGGVFGSGSASVNLTGSSISGNLAGGNGGGIFKSGGGLTVTGSTISGNVADNEGGGIFKSPTGSLNVLNITSSTLSGNSAVIGGGALLAAASPGTFVIRHSTVTANTASATGGGLFVASGTLSVDTTIVAQNLAGFGPDVTGLFGGGVDVKFSLIGSNANSGLVEAPVGAPDAKGSLIGGPMHGVINPQLDPLDQNGGTTFTHALLAGSPALDRGNPAAVAGSGGVPLRDQRGTPFTRVFGGRIDIGAFELQPLPVTMFGDYDANGAVDMADYILWRHTMGQSVAPYSGADGSGNGTIDQGDYLVWRANFGRTLGARNIASVEGGGGRAEGRSAEDPHPLDSSRPLPEGDVVVRPALPEVLGVARPEFPAMGVAAARTRRENHALRSRLRDVPRAARLDNSVAVWLSVRSSYDSGGRAVVDQRDILRDSPIAGTSGTALASDWVFEMLGTSNMAIVGEM